MSEWDEERLARAALTYVVMPGDGRLQKLVASEGAADILKGLARQGNESFWGRRAQAIDPEKIACDSEKLGIRFVIPGDSEWPEQLSDLDQCEDVVGMSGSPFGLWLKGKGNLARLAASSIAVVGSRAASRYGVNVAAEMSARLARNEYRSYAVVSGGAYGIDAAAHRGALSTGRTIAVCARGLDDFYPRSNRPVFEEIMRDGVICAEPPVGVEPKRQGFLARNRIIAALTKATVVVEAAARSGALNTATWANTLNRPIMAVPGSVNSTMSVGSNRLIRDGKASLVTGANDVLALVNELGNSPELAETGMDRSLDRLPNKLMNVREQLSSRKWKSTQELSIEVGFPVPQLMASLAELQLRGHAETDSAGRWRLAPAGSGGQSPLVF